jgi:hypothetical protein
MHCGPHFGSYWLCSRYHKFNQSPSPSLVVKQNLTSPQEKDPYSYQDLDEYFPHTPYITFPVYNAFYTVKERASQYQDDSHYEMSPRCTPPHDGMLLLPRHYSQA